MISDPKSAHFIAWTELGTSFVVSNVGEFSRSILGSHFKHNNFSSFVRQLNMYGFHKINRTPRAQRTSTDSQTWEFSHHKFLRGRPDLLDEIKRKALEPDLGAKHRVELPGEVAAQLAGMRDDNRRMWDALVHERRKVERLTNVVARLWDFVGKGFPGSREYISFILTFFRFCFPSLLLLQCIRQFHFTRLRCVFSRPALLRPFSPPTFRLVFRALYPPTPKQRRPECFDFSSVASYLHMFTVCFRRLHCVIFPFRFSMRSPTLRIYADAFATFTIPRPPYPL
ncbi:HSF-type DNA-binding-domain-containing protein [Armillaria borealis]|uniref:HSF-type DNA-binding-domain-containing protein n=1 Tax=Armillaria borealis TaxID=47425 RepID=A0AA39J6F2_9AGAR|nr:HSF-type DNA-binding-domain-containing protein [Armillaria borealis]